MIREVRMDEYEQLMELYLHLHETSVPPAELTRPLWERLVNDPDYHLIAAEEDGKLVSTVTCVIVRTSPTARARTHGSKMSSLTRITGDED